MSAMLEKKKKTVSGVYILDLDHLGLRPAVSLSLH